MMQYSVNFYEDFDRIMAVEGELAHAEFRQNGYLYLTDASKWERFERNFETQSSLGADVLRLTPGEVSALFDQINLEIALEGIDAGYWGPRDGRLDPYSALQGFVRKAKSLGASYVYDEVAGMRLKHGRIEALRTKKGDIFTGAVVVNAAGPWAQEVGKLAGIHLPVAPTNHMNFVCRITRGFRRRLPMVVFANRIWFMGESESQILTGLTKLDQEPVFHEMQIQGQHQIETAHLDCPGYSDEVQIPHGPRR